MTWRLLAVGGAAVAGGLSLHLLGRLLTRLTGHVALGWAVRDAGELLETLGAALAAAAATWILAAAAVGRIA